MTSYPPTSSHPRSIPLLFLTVTVLSGRLAKEGARYNLKGLVADPEEEDMDNLSQLKVNSHPLFCARYGGKGERRGDVRFLFGFLVL